MDLISGLVEEAAMTALPTSNPSSSSSSSLLATAVAVSSTTSAPIEVDQALLFIGLNDWDTLLSNNPTGLDEYHHIKFPTSVKHVFSSSTSFHFFVMTKDESLFAMGKNDHGQLGTGDLVSQKVPLKLSLDIGSSTIVKIATGKSHTLLLLANGQVFGAGSNLFGQLGLGDGKSVCKDFLKFTPLPLEDIADISAGENFSMACSRKGHVFVFGHPEHGQLGLGTTGEYIREGGKKGAAIQYDYVTRPRQLLTFFSKDAHGKVTESIPAERLKIRKVAAGKNHAMCLEDWEGGHQNRLFAWGFGGYGRLGHNGSSDELVPREVTYFNQTNAIKVNPQKFIRDIEACSSFSLAGKKLNLHCFIDFLKHYIIIIIIILVSETKAMYFWGKLSNSPRGEATVYPKIVQELCGFHTHGFSGTSNAVFVIADENVVAWGVPVTGKFGLEGGVKSSTVPKFVTDVNPYKPTRVVCGFGHICLLVEASSSSKDVTEKLSQLPVIVAATSSSSGAVVSTSSGKKQAAAGGSSTKDTSQVSKKAKK